MSIEKVLYTAQATATGGRDGRAVSSDNVLNIQLSTPKELGGGGGASPDDVATLVRVLPKKPDFRIVPKAVHMSFLTMCPKIDTSSQACIDAPGFDRAAFHRTFNTEVVAFFRRNLAD